MIAGVRALENLYEVDSPYFGNKANTLSQAMTWGISVLPGFCVTFDLKREYETQLQSFSIQIEQAYQRLMKECGACQVIVRSSVDLEDGENARFPGIFCSISSVSTLSQLYQAIQRCFDSARGSAVKYYTEANACGHQFQYFTVLIQKELQSQYAGLAATRIPIEGYEEDGVMLASLTKGNNHDLVKGIGPSNTYSFCLNQGEFSVHKIAGDVLINNGDLHHVFRLLYQILSGLRQRTGRNLEVEWGYAEEKVYIFQIRFSPKLTQTEDVPEAQAIVSFSGDAGQGFKYQAMQFFHAQGLFPRKTLFFPKEIPVKEVAQAIRTQMIDPPVTVRFSKKGEIGLPRAFTPNREAAADYVLDTKHPEWSVIVYSSLTVKKSFELYIDQDAIILEYVPGMWESDSTLAADTAVLTRDRACIWLVKQPRSARYEDEKGVYNAMVPSTTLSQMREELSRRILTLRRLREVFSRDLPLNVHFVSDGEQDYFLNCRRTHRIFWEGRYGGSVQVIENVADCRNWDGKSGVLFRPKLRRGEELLLFQFIPFLKSLSVPVFIEFGILSHPAIMLREFGISVVPYFLHHDYYEMSLEEI